MARIFGKQEIDVTGGAVDLLSFALYVRGVLEISPQLNLWTPPTVSLGALARPTGRELGEDWTRWWTGLLSAASADVPTRNGIEPTAQEALATLDPFIDLQESAMAILDEAIDWAAAERIRLGNQHSRTNGLTHSTAHAVESAARGRRPRILSDDLNVELRIVYLPAVDAWSGRFEPSLILIGEGLLGTTGAEQMAADAAERLVNALPARRR